MGTNANGFKADPEAKPPQRLSTVDAQNIGKLIKECLENPTVKRPDWIMRLIGVLVAALILGGASFYLDTVSQAKTTALKISQMQTEMQEDNEREIQDQLLRSAMQRDIAVMQSDLGHLKEGQADILKELRRNRD